MEGQKATAARAAQERAALGKVDRIRSENAARAEALEREAAEAEQKARALREQFVTAAVSSYQCFEHEVQRVAPPAPHCASVVLLAASAASLLLNARL